VSLLLSAVAAASAGGVAAEQTYIVTVGSGGVNSDRGYSKPPQVFTFGSINTDQFTWNGKAATIAAIYTNNFNAQTQTECVLVFANTDPDSPANEFLSLQCAEFTAAYKSAQTINYIATFTMGAGFWTFLNGKVGQAVTFKLKMP
jgi:hypothetical protein